ncbi:MAG: hypothetical protein JWP69_1692 [Flaviaesturariibacter sp.]|nr:hypothetical protein [Flaviaesturariibacter sp.]
MITVFFSYSHKDEELRNELDKHLSILKRQGVIDVWHDRCIIGGSEFESEISSHLKAANIILLLVSADFLASDYCYDKEMKLAMEMHERGDVVVLPVILRPCDWHDAPFGKLLATPKDGKPVVKYPTFDEAFLEVTNEIKRIVKTLPASAKKNEAAFLESSVPQPLPRSSNLRIRKQFSDHDKDKFLDEAFEYMAKYFEGSLKELQKRNTDVEYRFKRIDSQTFTAAVYIEGNIKTECMIFYGGASAFGFSKSISFTYSASPTRNSFNESLSLKDDGYHLYLSAIGMGMSFSSRRIEMLTLEGASEYYWELFIRRLQD